MAGVPRALRKMYHTMDRDVRAFLREMTQDHGDRVIAEAVLFGDWDDEDVAELLWRGIYDEDDVLNAIALLEHEGGFDAEEAIEVLEAALEMVEPDQLGEGMWDASAGAGRVTFWPCL